MTKTLVAAAVLVVSGTAVQPVFAQAQVSDTVRVAPPTGERETDRASILAALDEVEPGGTVRFAPGTYLVGEIIHVTVPGITVLGHPDGTTLRGCHPDMFQRQGGMEEMVIAVVSCNGLDMAGGHQTVRGLTFEYAWHALVLGGMECIEGRGCVPVLQPVESRPGGYRVENNTFRSTANGIRTLGQWSEPAVIRGNRFINTFHAVAVHGSIVHVVENEISVPEPERVPTGHPGVAMIVSATDLNSEAALLCAGNMIAGNRISGHPDGIAILLLRAGVSCRDNVIRENAIAVERVKVPASWWGVTPTESDSSAVGVPIALINEPKADPEVFGSAEVDEQEGMLEGNLIEGNTIVGAEGIGIELFHASGNRIVNNTIARVARRDPFPGITVNSFDPQKSGWLEANGSGIWVSPGSDGNEIVDNTFEDVAGVAVFMEGNRNVVTTRSPEDEVRDLGSENRVTARTDEARPEDAVEAALRAYLDDYAAQDPEAWLEHVTGDFLLIENGYRLEPDRFTEAWDPENPLSETYQVHDLEIVVAGEVALYRYDLGWYESGDQVFWGVESGHARLVEGAWRLAQTHMTWLPPRGTVSPHDLRDYVGEYQRSDFQGGDYRLILFLEDDQLYMRRPGGDPVAASVGRVRLIPGPAEDQFFVEFVNGEMRFRRDREGRVTGYRYILPLEVLPGLPDQVESVKVR